MAGRLTRAVVGAVAGAWLGLGACVCAAHRTAAPRLNLLLVTADDLNADSSGWMGNALGATPHLDAFATTSHRFSNHHVTAPICQPSRAALMTGRVPHRSGALGFGPIDDGVPTLVEVLRARGYFTAAINKLAHMAPRRKFPWDMALRGTGRDPRALGAHVARGLAAARASDRPFFINANIVDPHRPFRPAGAAPALGGRHGGYRPGDVVVPGFLEDLHGVRLELARYFTSIAHFDAALGQVLEALEAAGHRDDTIVVVLSDNGMSFPFSKGSVYRSGTWSPVVLRYPGMAPPVTHEELVSSVDVMPTLLELLDVAPPAGMDGRSWGPILRGEVQDGREFLVTHVNTVRSGRSFPQRCVRTSTYALMFHGWADGRTRFRVEATRGAAFRALARAARTDPRIAARVRQLVAGSTLALYDLERDPGERENQIDAPAYRDEVERLQRLLLAHMEATGDPQRENFRRAVDEWRCRQRPSAAAGGTSRALSPRGRAPQPEACPRGGRACAPAASPAA